MVNQFGKPIFMIFNFIRLLIVFCFTIMSCSSKEDSSVPYYDPNGGNSNGGGDGSSNMEQYADIDFTNWKLTLPVDENENGKPDEYYPDQLVNNGYRTLTAVSPYMYDDTSDGSIVFYTFPDTSTTNSSYSRTELRELINPENALDNWSLSDGGEMTGRLKVSLISQDNDSSSDYHKVIVMQIHGIISEEDMETYNFSSTNGPPLIKIYWKDGYIWSHKKVLVDDSTSGSDLIQPYTSSNNFWTDDKDNLGFVGYEPFDFRITASATQIEVQLNQEAPVIYQDLSLEKWQYNNYFKAGNYLGTTDPQGFCYVKYYNLNVTH